MRAETLTGGRAGTAQPGRPGIPVTLTTVCRRTITKHIAIKFFHAEIFKKAMFVFSQFKAIWVNKALFRAVKSL